MGNMLKLYFTQDEQKSDIQEYECLRADRA